MDIKNLIVEKNNLVSFLSSLSYDTNFVGDTLMPDLKTKDIPTTYRTLSERGSLPMLAPAHALDTEATIVDRPNLTENALREAFIKAKIDQGERIRKVLGASANKDSALSVVYNDIDNLVYRVKARAEKAKMDALSKGEVVYDENNVKFKVTYGVPDKNKIDVTAWDDPAHDIIADIERIQYVAEQSGKNVVRALTSSTIVKNLVNNTGIRSYFANSTSPITKQAVLDWIRTNYGVEIKTNDLRFGTNYTDDKTYRFWDENTISWFTTDSILGRGLYGVTPEEEGMKLSYEISQKLNVVVTQWETPDPVTVWTKASALFVPVISDPTGLFISKHTPKNA